MARHISFEVEGDVYQAFSPNRHVSHWEKRRRVTAWRQRVWAAWYRVGAVSLTPPVRVIITVFRARDVDQENLISSMKSVIDGLTPMKRGPMQQACLPDDSRKTCTVEVRLAPHPEWKRREWLSIYVTEVSYHGQ